MVRHDVPRNDSVTYRGSCAAPRVRAAEAQRVENLRLCGVPTAPARSPRLDECMPSLSAAGCLRDRHGERGGRGALPSERPKADRLTRENLRPGTSPQSKPRSLSLRPRHVAVALGIGLLDAQDLPSAPRRLPWRSTAARRRHAIKSLADAAPPRRAAAGIRPAFAMRASPARIAVREHHFVPAFAQAAERAAPPPRCGR